MALVDIPGGLWIPPTYSHATTAQFVASTNMDSAAEKFAIIFRVPKTGTLDWFELRQGVNTATPDPGLTFSFQGLTANEPDGVLAQFRAMTTGFGVNTWLVPPGVMTNDGTDVGVKRAVTRGDWLACVIEFTATYVAGNVNWSLLDITTTVASSSPGNLYHYARSFTTAWAAAPANYPICALRYADGSYAVFAGVILPLSTITARTFNDTSTPGFSGIRFSLPGPVSLAGAWTRFNPSTIDYELRLYNMADSLLGTIPMPGDKRKGSGTINAHGLFTSSISLAAATDYRLVVRPTTTSNITIHEYGASTSALRAAFPMGATRQLTTGAPGGWTETDTSYGPDMGLIIDGIDDGGGGPGGGGGRAFSFVG